MVEPGDLAGEAEDAPGHLRLAREHLGLDLVDVQLQAFGHGHVTVHHVIEDRVHHGDRTRSQIGRGLFEPVPDTAQIGYIGVTDRDHVVRPDEHVHFPVLDGLLVVEVAGRTQHDQVVVAVAVVLGTLPALHGVLHGQLMQPQAVGELGQVVLIGAVQRDPGHPAGGAQCAEGLLQAVRFVHSLARGVDHVGDDRHRSIVQAGGT